MREVLCEKGFIRFRLITKISTYINELADI